MMPRFLSFSVCCLLLLVTSCQSDSSSATDKNTQLNYETLAKDFCDCASESIALNTEMKGYLNAGDDRAFDATVNKVQVAFDGAILCAKSAKNKQTDQAIDKKRLGASLKKSCSEMPPRLTLELLDKVR